MEKFVEEVSRLSAQYGLRAIGALVLFFGAWIASAWLSRWTRRGLERAKMDVMLAKFLGTLTRWVVMVLAVIAILGIFGVQTASFAAVIGSAGLAIGLAMQGSLSNLAAGVMLMIFRPFRVGDAVVVAGQMGIVDMVELFSTHMDTPDNRRVIIPNAQVFGSIIENITFHPVRRADVDVSVEPGADIDQTAGVLTKAAESVPGRVTERGIEITLKGLGAASLDWRVSVWAKRDDFMTVRHAAFLEVRSALQKANIAAPVPRMVVQGLEAVKV